MSERLQHNNPWADKLSQVSLPDGGESWKAMEALLDREMPAGWRRDRRRWFLLIVLLLLLIGVCNCPGTRSFFGSKEETGGVRPVKEGGKVGAGPSAGAVGGPSAGADKVVKAGGGLVDSAGVHKKPGAGGGVAEPEMKGVAGAKRRSGSMGRAGDGDRSGGTAKGKTKHATRNPGGGLVSGSAGDLGSDTVRGVRNAKKTGAVKNGRAAGGVRSDTAVGGVRSDTTVGGAKIVAKKPAKNLGKDTTKKDATKKAEKKERNDGWVVGVGLNQFFTVGGQQPSSFNSGGITGTLGDYIPVPMVRYYFNPKLYVQLEAQLNTPQYTKKNLVALSTPADSIGTTTTGQTIRTQTTVAINKLFYFNIPLSVHYTVFDHLDLGTGFQYSRLTNGVGVFNNNIDTGTNNSLTVETKSFKGDTIYKRIKTYEFRFLVDVNYTWQHFIFGLRYNQALSQFIHVEVSPGQVTQARNSSLQLYLRYILFDGRKKKAVLPAK